jgi:hypothetical protein
MQILVVQNLDGKCPPLPSSSCPADAPSILENLPPFSARRGVPDMNVPGVLTSSDQRECREREEREAKERQGERARARGRSDAEVKRFGLARREGGRMRERARASERERLLQSVASRGYTLANDVLFIYNLINNLAPLARREGGAQAVAAKMCTKGRAS